VVNLGLGALNAGLVSLAGPLSLMAIAALGQQRQWGLFGLVSAPPPVVMLGSLLLLDLTVYFQHRLFHAVGPLWRLHRMHHSDIRFDTTTGVRFHPGEALLSMLVKSAAVIAIGAPVAAVLAFEIVLNAISMFNHANLRLPAVLDRWLRHVVVTPDMHRVHHSIEADELNRNFGFNLSCWDRLFGTYRAQPAGGHAGMTIGLSRFRAPVDQRVGQLLLQPLR
jgi:sterol desaturase/sphingolipid hydroxylase (fatty acid hydroxylase superfamily)